MPTVQLPHAITISNIHITIQYNTCTCSTYIVNRWGWIWSVAVNRVEDGVVEMLLNRNQGRATANFEWDFTPYRCCVIESSSVWLWKLRAQRASVYLANEEHTTLMHKLQSEKVTSARCNADWTWRLIQGWLAWVRSCHSNKTTAPRPACIISLQVTK